MIRSDARATRRGDDASGRRWTRAARALVALLALAGLGYSLVLGSDTRFPDEDEYLRIADSIVHAGTYGFAPDAPNAIRPPGYPFLIAPVAAASGTLVGPESRRAATVHAVRTLQFLGLGVSALMLASLAGDGRGAGTAGAAPGTGSVVPRGALGCAMVLGLAGYPVLIYTAGTLFPQAAILVLAALVLWLLERARAGAGAAAVIGLLCGAVAEVSPTALTLVPLALLHAALSPRWRARHVAIIALAAALLPGAWLARNLVTLDETILFSRNLAYNLDNAVLALDPLEADEEREPDDVFGYGAERLLQIVGDPGPYFERLQRHFAWRNKLYVAEESSAARDLVMLASYSALLALVALRLALARREPLSRAERSVLALYAMTAAFHALVFVRIRYRVPFDFLLFLPALNGVLIAVGALLARRRGASRDATTTVP